MAFSEPNFASLVRSLPRELQEMILSNYLGNSYARLAYLNNVFAGDSHTEMRDTIAECFRPRRTAIYLRPALLDCLSLVPQHTAVQRLTTDSLLRAAGPGSGVMIVLFGMVGDHTDWRQGELLVLGPDVTGWIDVVEYRSGSTRWDFTDETFEDWLDHIINHSTYLPDQWIN